MKKILFFAATALLLSAQTSSVIAVTPSETKEAQVAYKKFKAAEKEWEEVKGDLRKKYKLSPTADINFNKDFTAFELYNSYNNLIIVPGSGSITVPCDSPSDSPCYLGPIPPGFQPIHSIGSTK